MKPSRLLRRHLILTTILTAAPLMTYGRQVEAACVANPAPPTFLCSGVNTATQVIDADNADVTTAPGFSVDAATDNGITIMGDGALKFIDNNRSTIKGEFAGLDVYATDDLGGIPGSATIATNGNVVGGVYGIRAKNRGSGAISITADGNVTGIDFDGIYAIGYAGSGGMTITTGTDSVITGGDDGIDADNGGGSLAITVKGTIMGGYEGIEADNRVGSLDLTIITEAGSTVAGLEGDGISAWNSGTGNLAVTVKGEVMGQEGDGIFARNEASGADLTVTAGVGSRVVGTYDGVDADHRGSGDLTIAVNGEVTGGGRGISADNDGDGNMAITIGSGGVVQGGSAALLLDSDNSQAISIFNDGVIRNLSGAAGDLAVGTASGANTTIGDIYMENGGTLTGRITFADGDDSLISSGTWNMRGISDFGFGDDFVDNKGALIAAGDGATAEQTSLDNLERLRNSGLITLVDGGAGDRLAIVDGSYESDGGALAVDAVLGEAPAGRSDALFFGGVFAGGVTKVSVNVLDAIGANSEGITVVEGESSAGDFVLKDGPISAGFFTWDMRYDEINQWHELYSSGIGVGAYELAAGITGARDIWHQTTGTLLQRQADLRPLLDGTQVTPVADFTEPVAPTSVGRAGPGFWMTGVGAWLDRDAEQDGFTLDRTQTVYGGLAGFDFALEEAGDAWLFGVFGGYVGSTLKFSDTNSRWTYDGPSVGAYVTYLNDAFYADLTVKADFLSIAIDPEDMAQAADDADTDAVNLGGRIDTGYKFGAAEGAFIEPQATLSVVNSDIDDADIYGGTADFEDETSVKGRIGLRLGVDHTGSNAVVYSSDVTASVWHEFNDNNSVSIATPDVPSFTVSDDTVPTVGDISLGFGVVSPDGWSGFLRGNYQFAEDYDAITGNAGLRYAW